MCIFQLLYLYECRPFTDPKDAWVENLEELSVLSVACILPDFTNLYDDAEMKWKLGWFIIAVVFLNLLVNSVLIVLGMGRTLVRVYKLAKVKILMLKREK